MAKSTIYSIASTDKPLVSAEIAMFCPDPNCDELFLFTHFEKVAHKIPVLCTTLLEDCSPSFTSKTAFSRSSL